MTGLIVLVAALATAEALPETRPYAEAYRQHVEQNKPLVVLVGADWCPACRTMSSRSLPDASRNGALRDVAFAVVDVDDHPELAGKLLRGSSIPQLVMYYKSSDGMRRSHLTGAQDADAIARFIQSARDAGGATTPVSIGEMSQWAEVESNRAASAPNAASQASVRGPARTGARNTFGLGFPGFTIGGG